MASILWFPLPELGHILPTLALTRQLTQAGHRVVYLTAPQFRPDIEAVGGTIEPLVNQHFGEMMSGSSIWYRFSNETAGDCRSERLRQAIGNLVDKKTYDLVMLDRILVLNYRSDLASTFARQQILLFSTSLFNWHQYKSVESDYPMIIFCPSQLELQPFRTKRSNVFHVECSFPPGDVPDKLQGIDLTGAPLVLASFGTQSTRYTDLIKRLHLLDELARRHPEIQFIAATGRSPRAIESIQRVHSTNISFLPSIPQRNLLRHACLLITHGGLGSIKEAVFEGVPTLVLPVLHDQPFNAMRVRHHKLGDAVFSDKLSVPLVNAILIKALGGAYAEPLAQMQAVFIALERSRLAQLLVGNRLASIENVAK